MTRKFAPLAEPGSDETASRPERNAVGIDLDVLSVRGPIREENQDAALAWKGEDGEVFAIISDGMGGHESGREAAEIVVRTCVGEIQHRNGQPWPAVLKSAIGAAHEEVTRAIEARQGARMGATVVLAALVPGSGSSTLRLAHVGDSRAYLCRGHSIYRLTSDHSLIGQMVRDGYLTEEEAFGHPDNNIIQRAIGQSAPLVVELQDSLRLEAGDTVILCSDGLHGVVPDSEILTTVRRASGSREVCRELLDASLRSGSEDNVSIACLRLPKDRHKPRPTRPEA